MAKGPGIRLFVYGTLMRAEANHVELAEAIFSHRTRTADGFELWDLGAYPGMRRAASGSVAGELFQCTLEQLPRLDDFEGHPELFRREHIQLEDGSLAYAYLCTAETLQHFVVHFCDHNVNLPGKIQLGDWRLRHRR